MLVMFRIFLTGILAASLYFGSLSHLAAADGKTTEARAMAKSPIAPTLLPDVKKDDPTTEKAEKSLGLLARQQ